MLGSVEKGIWVGFSTMNIITVCVCVCVCLRERDVEQYIEVGLGPHAGILTWDLQAQEPEDITLPSLCDIQGSGHLAE